MFKKYFSRSSFSPRRKRKVRFSWINHEKIGFGKEKFFELPVFWPR